jgi:HEAT repeat protein
MLAVFLIFSGTAYYIQNARLKLRAAAIVCGLILFGVLFVGGLSRFNRVAPETTAKEDIIGVFLKALTTDDQAAQLDGIKHLREMADPRIVPALDSLMARTRSDEVAEAIATALSQQKDPRAIPALRRAASGAYDFFLKLTIAEAQLHVGDNEGYRTLMDILKHDDAGYARHQASTLLEQWSGENFGYDPNLPAAANSSVLSRMEEWYSTTGSRAKIVDRHRQPAGRIP